MKVVSIKDPCKIKYNECKATVNHERREKSERGWERE